MERFNIKNLDCPHCAKEVEEAVAGVPGISDVTLNFITGVLEFSSDGEGTTLNALKAAKNAEPGIVITNAHENCESCRQEHSHGNGKAGIIRLIIAFIIFALAFFVGGKAGTSLFMISYFYIGYPVIINAVKKGGLDENFLMTVASAGAFILGHFSEGAAVMLFYSLGECFQDMAVSKNRKSIKELMDISPDYAVRETGEKVSPEEIAAGDIIIVNPGEKIPLDGIISSGETEIDASSLTGESLPVYKKAGDEILSGTLNLSGSIKIKTTGIYKNSTVSKILDMVENASAKKAKTEKFITSFAKIYTPAVVALASLIAVIGGLLTKDFSAWIYRGLSFLVVSCPCALVLSVPLSFYSGISRAAKSGILIKGGNVVEKIGKTENIIFDKTGTLTKGSFTISKIVSKTLPADEFLKIVVYTEYFSNHPIAKSICKHVDFTIDTSRISDYKEIPGCGVSCILSGAEAIGGNAEFMIKNGINPEKTEATAVHIALSGEYLGFIELTDEIKDKFIVKHIKSAGVKKAYMLTGDSEKSAESVARALGIDEYYHSLLPQDKVEKAGEIARLGVTMAVGDGINDAPMLAMSDISVAMGSGSAASAEAADIVIMTDNISKILDLFKLAGRTMARVTQNIYFSIGVKCLVLLLTALGICGMWAAVFADVGVSVLAILNAVRK